MPITGTKRRRLSTQDKKDRQFVKCVLEEYAKRGRHDLPWRKKMSPYAILVSEIMLQQTQVKRVIPKFLLWMKTYPTLASLKRATLSNALPLWQGLGYQRRAKYLLEISRAVSDLPKSFEEMKKLPGVGTYTASALCAFAYDKFEHPLLETNIRTALIEAFHKRKSSVSDDTLYRDLERFILRRDVARIGARAWYCALMDYGATLKARGISHNLKSKGYAKQSPYKGSFRELRARILFSIANGKAIPDDARALSVLKKLESERFIARKGNAYVIAR